MKQIMSPKSILAVCTLVGALSFTACSQSKSSAEASPSAEQTAEVHKVAYVDAKEAHALLTTQPETVVLDVRTQKEIDEGHIEGAVFANFRNEDFTVQLSKLDRQTSYVVHCKSGGRSTKTLAILNDLGFRDVTHMDGGLDGWKRAGLPLSMP